MPCCTDASLFGWKTQDELLDQYHEELLDQRLELDDCLQQKYPACIWLWLPHAPGDTNEPPIALQVLVGTHMSLPKQETTDVELEREELEEDRELLLKEENC